MEDNRKHPMSDWKYEVANDDTHLGYADWLEAQLEADDDSDMRARRDHCKKHGHSPDSSTLVQANGTTDLCVDVQCGRCKQWGSFAIDPVSVQFEDD